jgi:hypothetical protein
VLATALEADGAGTGEQGVPEGEEVCIDGRPLKIAVTKDQSQG